MQGNSWLYHEYLICRFKFLKFPLPFTPRGTVMSIEFLKGAGEHAMQASCL